MRKAKPIAETKSTAAAEAGARHGAIVRSRFEQTVAAARHSAHFATSYVGALLGAIRARR